MTKLFGIIQLFPLAAVVYLATLDGVSGLQCIKAYKQAYDSGGSTKFYSTKGPCDWRCMYQVFGNPKSHSAGCLAETTWNAADMKEFNNRWANQEDIKTINGQGYAIEKAFVCDKDLCNDVAFQRKEAGTGTAHSDFQLQQGWKWSHLVLMFASLLLS